MSGANYNFVIPHQFGLMEFQIPKLVRDVRLFPSAPKLWRAGKLTSFANDF